MNGPKLAHPSGAPEEPELAHPSRVSLLENSMRPLSTPSTGGVVLFGQIKTVEYPSTNGIVLARTGNDCRVLI